MFLFSELRASIKNFENLNQIYQNRLFHCYNDNKPPIKHLLAMYKCNDIFQSLTIEYLHGGIPKNMKDMKPCDLIYKIMIN